MPATPALPPTLAAAAAHERGRDPVVPDEIFVVFVRLARLCPLRALGLRALGRRVTCRVPPVSCCEYWCSSREYRDPGRSKPGRLPSRGRFWPAREATPPRTVAASAASEAAPAPPPTAVRVASAATTWCSSSSKTSGVRLALRSVWRAAAANEDYALRHRRCRWKAMQRADLGSRRGARGQRRSRRPRRSRGRRRRGRQGRPRRRRGSRRRRWLHKGWLPIVCHSKSPSAGYQPHPRAPRDQAEAAP